MIKKIFLDIVILHYRKSHEYNMYKSNFYTVGEKMSLFPCFLHLVFYAYLYVDNKTENINCIVIIIIDPQPPQHVTASSINDGVLVSWTVPPSTIFNTKEYTVEFSRNNWILKEEIYVSADKNEYFISKVLPSTTLYVKVYTCICHSIRSSPSREVSQFVGGRNDI